MMRFAVVRHSNQRQRLAIHHLLRSYHWHSIDPEHVLLLGDVSEHHHNTLDDHPDVLLLPSIHSSKTVVTHARERDKHHHYIKLQKLGVVDTHRTSDVAELAVQRFGLRFSLEQ